MTASVTQLPTGLSATSTAEPKPRRRGSASSEREQPATDPLPEYVNSVTLVGRISPGPEERQLPSGDELVTFRLVVPRNPAVMKRRGSAAVDRRLPTHDTIDCVAWTRTLRKRVLGLQTDTTVEVTGSLRRRFYRGPAGLGSRYEVEVDGVVVRKP